MEILRLDYLYSLDTHNITLSAGATKDQFPFIAIVTFGGRPSDGLVGGTDQIPGGPYRVDIPTAVLQEKIGDLVGKPVFASESLASHEHSVEIGEFMQAWVEPFPDPETGEFVSVAKASGMLFRDRNPELVDRVISGARNGIMGFSWDIGAVKFNLEELAGGEKIVKVSDLQWHGATVLKKETAAYQFTQLAASKISEQKEYDNMNEKEIVAAIKGTIGEEFQKYEASSVTKDDLTEITESIEGLKGEFGDLKAKHEEIAKGITKQEPKGDPKPKEDPPEGELVTMKDFMGGIAKALTDALKPMQETLGELKTAMAGKEPEGDPTSNGRRSHRGGEIEKIFAKYVDDDEVEEGGERTVEGLKIAISAVKDKVKNRRQRDEMLATLGAERRTLIKQKFQREQLGIVD